MNFPGPYTAHGDSWWRITASNGNAFNAFLIDGPDAGEETDDQRRHRTAELCALLNAGWEAKQKDRPRVVCLCGSGRFKDAFDDAEFSETLAGRIVLTIGCNTKDIARTPDLEHHKPMLDELHKRKIDLADEVLVLNVGGYIGSSTRSEIDYAIAHGKPVRYLEDGGTPESRIARDLGVPVEKLMEIATEEAKKDMLSEADLPEGATFTIWQDFITIYTAQSMVPWCSGLDGFTREKNPCVNKRPACEDDIDRESVIAELRRRGQWRDEPSPEQEIRDFCRIPQHTPKKD